MLVIKLYLEGAGRGDGGGRRARIPEAQRGGRAPGAGAAAGLRRGSGPWTPGVSLTVAWLQPRPSVNSSSFFRPRLGSRPPGPCVGSIGVATGPASGFAASHLWASTPHLSNGLTTAVPRLRRAPRLQESRPCQVTESTTSTISQWTLVQQGPGPRLSLLHPMLHWPPEVQPLCQPSFRAPLPPPRLPRDLLASWIPAPPPELPYPSPLPLACLLRGVFTPRTT